MIVLRMPAVRLCPRAPEARSGRRAGEAVRRSLGPRATVSATELVRSVRAGPKPWLWDPAGPMIGSMTLHGGGYFLDSRAALEHLDMGGGSVLSLKVTSEQSNGQLTVLEGVVHAGGPPLHVHEAEDEVVIVLSGELTYRVGDQSGTADGGGLLWFPRGVPHAVANLTDSPCRFLTVVAPGGIEDFFRAQRDYLASLPEGVPPDAAALASVPGAQTRRVVGPPLSATP